MKIDDTDITLWRISGEPGSLFTSKIEAEAMARTLYPGDSAERRYSRITYVKLMGSTQALRELANRVQAHVESKLSKEIADALPAQAGSKLGELLRRPLKWWCFTQNNTGGSFDHTADLAPHVLIQGPSIEWVTRRAQELGIYFNGVQDGKDCSCCGDRWRKPYGEGTDEPLIYGDPPEKASPSCVGRGNSLVVLHPLDGNKRTIYVER